MHTDEVAEIRSAGLKHSQSSHRGALAPTIIKIIANKNDKLAMEIVSPANYNHNNNKN
jgi:hypothetical protein